MMKFNYIYQDSQQRIILKEWPEILLFPVEVKNGEIREFMAYITQGEELMFSAYGETADAAVYNLLFLMSDKLNFLDSRRREITDFCTDSKPTHPTTENHD